MSVNEIAEARALKDDDSTKWSVKDALYAMIRDIDCGEIEPECVSISFFKKNGDGFQYGFYAANLKFDRHIALLNIALTYVIERWRE